MVFYQRSQLGEVGVDLVAISVPKANPEGRFRQLGPTVQLELCESVCCHRPG